MEPGYILLNKISHKIGNDYNGFVIMHTITYLSILFAAIRKQARVGLILLLLYSGHLLGWMGSNRQIIAIMICIYAGEKLYYGKKIQFFSIVTVASFFHVSAISFTFMYFINKYFKYFKVKTYVAILFVCIILNYILINSDFVSEISRGLYLLFDKDGKLYVQLNVYSSDQFRPDMITSSLMLFKRLLIVIFIMFCLKIFGNNSLSNILNNQPQDKVQNQVQEQNNKFKYYFTAYYLSIIIVLIVNPIFPILATRGGAYFYLYEILLFTVISVNFTPKSYLAFMTLFLVFCFARLNMQLQNDSDLLLPYKSIWINTSHNRKMY